MEFLLCLFDLQRVCPSHAFMVLPVKKSMKGSAARASMVTTGLDVNTVWKDILQF